MTARAASRTSSRLAQAPAPGIKTFKNGIYYTAAGLVFGLIGFARLLTLFGPALNRFNVYTCAQPVSDLSLPRSQVIVAIVAGLFAVICAEVGSRRHARPKWVGMSASILGIFTLLGGGLIAFELFLPPITNCVR
jgi:hypothetical protein